MYYTKNCDIAHWILEVEILLAEILCKMVLFISIHSLAEVSVDEGLGVFDPMPEEILL